MNKHDTIGDRLKEWIKTNKLSASDFAKQLEVQRSALSHIFSGRNKPSVDVLIKIKNAYPNMSLDWLITGKLDTKNKPEEPKNAESIDETNTSEVTDVNYSNLETDNQSITKFKQIENKNLYRDHKLNRIIELYSDGTFKFYDL